METHLTDGGSERQAVSRAVRKQVTVLFCDIAGYTERATSIDPEELAEDIREFHQSCSRIAAACQGYVSSYQGDGIMVLFGHPHASEFSPERAVRAGMDMVQAVQRLNQQPHWRSKAPLSIRIGIATGLVVVEDRHASGQDHGEHIFGSAPNLAARLQAEASPDTVVVSLKTRRLVGLTFKFKDLGEFRLKGFEKPIRAWQILHERPLQKRPGSILKRNSVAFISRQKEQSELNRAFDSACYGFCRFVHLVGDPGIGKSRLVRNFEKQHARQNIHRIRINCSPYFQTSFLKPVRDECRRWLRISADDDLETQQASVSWALGVVPLDDVERQLLFTEFLEIDPPTESHLPDINPEEKRRRTIDVLAKIIIALSRSEPLLLVAEDLHWADPSTLELLTVLMRLASEERILGILTSRPHFKAPWGDYQALTTMTLEGLTQVESRQLVEALVVDQHLPESLKQSVVRKSDGIPLYIEECCFSVLSQYSQAGDESMVRDYHVPETLQDSLNARLDQLGPVKTLAQLASTFGESFSYADLDTIAQLNDIDADSGMDTLLEVNILVPDVAAVEDRFRFRHLLFQEAAYQSLLIRTRQHFHEQIAELFLTREPDFADRHPELVAHHLSHTNQINQAVGLWIKAGQLAIENSAFAESIDHLHRGLSLIQKLQAGEGRRRQELELLLQLGVSLTARGGYYGYEVTRTYERAVELAREVGDELQEWTALYGLWRCLISQADYRGALRIVTLLSARSQRMDQAILRATAVGIQAMTRLVDGKLARADKLSDQSVVLYGDVRETRFGLRFGQDPFVTIQGLGAVAKLLRGRLPESVQAIYRSLDVTRGIDHPYTVAETLKLAAMYEQISRNVDKLRQLSLEAMDISEKYGFEGVLATHRIFLAFADLVTNRDMDQLEVIRDNLVFYEKKYGLLFLPYFQGIQVEGQVLAEQFQDAFESASHILRTIKSSSENWMHPGVLLLKARAAAAGNLASATECRQWYLDSLKRAADQDALLTLVRGLRYGDEFGVRPEQLESYQQLCESRGDTLSLVHHDYVARIH